MAPGSLYPLTRVHWCRTAPFLFRGTYEPSFSGRWAPRCGTVMYDNAMPAVRHTSHVTSALGLSVGETAGSWRHHYVTAVAKHYHPGLPHGPFMINGSGISERCKGACLPWLPFRAGWWAETRRQNVTQIPKLAHRCMAFVLRHIHAPHDLCE